MADLAAALGGAIESPGPLPGSGPALVRELGGKDATVQALSGLTHAPRRGDYGDAEAFRADQLRWRAARRRVQRWTTQAGAQQRGRARLSLTPAETGRVQQMRADRRESAAVRHGARMRIHARIRIDSPTPGHRADVRTRWMPASGPGVYIRPAEMDRVLAAREGPDGEAGAAVELLNAFALAYGINVAMDVEEVLALKLWPDGTPEP